MSDLIFEKFPSIKRMKRGCVITEKLDGTNAQIQFNADGDILCGSRKRRIVPGDDNAGFAKWAYENQIALMDTLGEGKHYGEWWGSGIGRKYGFKNGEKMFSLFNTGRWNAENTANVDQLRAVPVLYTGDFDTGMVDATLYNLRETGSIAAPRFMKPEGIVVFHSQLKEMFKITFEHDAKGKPFGA